MSKGDTSDVAKYLAEKTATLRIFADQAGKMNRSLVDISGAALVVSQFTLYGDARGQRRPSFTDSKVVPPDERDVLAALIVGRATAWAVAIVEADEIDRLNIHRASLQAMRQAVGAMAPLPDAVLVDGFRIPDLAIPQRGIVKGDRRCAAIAAASIVAKVTRDRLMQDLDVQDPRYGFARHKGYATAEHLEAVARYGYSAVHRRSFRPPTLFD